MKRNPFTIRLLAIVAGITLTGTHAMASPVGRQLRLTPTSIQASAVSATALQVPPLPFPLDGSPVYVLLNDSWREARLASYRWGSLSGFRYSVVYVSNNSREENVTVDRILSLTQAQQRGLSTTVYDLSSQAGIDQMVDAHNQARSQVGVAPLQWSPQLAAYAQEWANKLVQENRFEHRPDSPYGENLTAATGQQLTPARVVKSWSDELVDYSYTTNTCTTGKACGHYTQVVWRASTQVGCGMARSASQEVWVCNYNPPGNYVGQQPY